MDSRNQNNSFDERSLIMMALNGDLDAFNELVLFHQNVAYNHASALSDDVTQESFIKAFQSLRSFRAGSFRGWLLKIVTNSARDMMRRSHKHPTQALFPEDGNGEEMESVSWLADPNTLVQDIVEQNEFSKDIYRSLDELPDKFKSVITLIDLHDLDYEEAAEVLNIPIGTVKSRLARARLQLQKKFKNNLGHGSGLSGNISLAA